MFLHRVLGSWVFSLCEDLARCGFRSCAVFCVRVVLQLRLSIKTLTHVTKKSNNKNVEGIRQEVPQSSFSEVNTANSLKLFRLFSIHVTFF